jgi:hypothetical protein
MRIELRTQQTPGWITFDDVTLQVVTTASVATKYYYAGSQRVAMRQNGVLYYLLSDHLGSTSIVANSSGSRYSEQRYKA